MSERERHMNIPRSGYGMADRSDGRMEHHAMRMIGLGFAITMIMMGPLVSGLGVMMLYDFAGWWPK